MTEQPTSDADMPCTVALTGLPSKDSRRTPSASTGRRALAFPRVPGYEILGELGRGGMGVVFKARQLRLNRVVALKMLLRPDEADPADVLRFRSEAEAVASVEHPHVVHVHESGMFDSGPFLAMEYLGGGTLHHRLRERFQFAPAEAADLVGKLARAVHAAHAQGIVHRDLKPGNVLFDAAGEPRVTDFGLAKRVAHDLTRTQAILGTPAYMAPEQAAGNARSVGPAADIYALGVILYECLAGEPPFTGGESVALLHRVIHDPAPSPRAKAPDTPRDLDLICRKCLEKRPADRYPTAAALADDLARFAAKEPVSVRPAGVVERTLKWARRRPTVAAAYALGGLAVVLLALGGGAAVLWRQAATARDDANAQRVRAEGNEDAVTKEKEKVERAGEELEKQNEALEKTEGELRKANAALRVALASQQEALAKEQAALAKEKEALRSERDAAATLAAERTLAARVKYFRDVNAAMRELNDRNVARAVQLLNETPEKLRGWEWHHVMRAAHPEVGTGRTAIGPTDVAFDPSADGNVVAAHVGTAGSRRAGGGVTRFDFAVKKGAPTQFAIDRPLYSVKVSADGRRALAVAFDRDTPKQPWVVSVWDVAGNAKLGEWRALGAGGVHAEAISCDGSRVFVAIVGEPVRGYDVASGKELAGSPDRVPPDASYGGCHLRLAGDGRTAAMAFPKETVLWDAASGKATARLPHRDAKPISLALDAAGTAVATGTHDGDLNVEYVGHVPAGRRAFFVPKAHAGRLGVAAFHPTQPLLATAGEDGTVRVWNLATGAAEHVFLPHALRVFGLNFSPDGQRLVAVGEDHYFRVWPLVGTAGPVYPWPVPNKVAGEPGEVFLSPDGKRGLATGDGRTVRLWEPDGTGFKQHRLEVPGNRILAAAHHPSRPQAALADADGRVWLWDYPAAPKELFTLARGVRPQVAYTPDGARLIAARAKDLRIWDLAAGASVGAPPLPNIVTHLAVSGDGTRIALGHDHYAIVYDADGKPLGETAGGGGVTGRGVAEITALAFGPTAESVLVGRANWQVQEYTLANRDKPRRAFKGHSAAVTAVAVTPDGTRVATGAFDGRVKVWDYETGEEAVGLTTGPRVSVARLAFVRGRSWVATPKGGVPTEFDGGPSHVLWLEKNGDRPPPVQK